MSRGEGLPSVTLPPVGVSVLAGWRRISSSTCAPFEHLHHRQRTSHAGLTQAELAKPLGRHQSVVVKYESGQRRLNVIELNAVAEDLEAALAEFAQISESLRSGDVAEPKP